MIFIDNKKVEIREWKLDILASIDTFVENIKIFRGSHPQCSSRFNFKTFVTPKPIPIPRSPKLRTESLDHYRFQLTTTEDE